MPWHVCKCVANEGGCVSRHALGDGVADLVKIVGLPPMMFPLESIGLNHVTIFRLPRLCRPDASVGGTDVRTGSDRP